MSANFHDDILSELINPGLSIALRTMLILVDSVYMPKYESKHVWTLNLTDQSVVNLFVLNDIFF